MLMNEIISFMANPKADIESGNLDDEPFQALGMPDRGPGGTTPISATRWDDRTDSQRLTIPLFAMGFLGCSPRDTGVEFVIKDTLFQAFNSLLGEQAVAA